MSDKDKRWEDLTPRQQWAWIASQLPANHAYDAEGED